MSYQEEEMNKDEKQNLKKKNRFITRKPIQLLC